MIIYHEVKPKLLKSVLQHGLDRTSRGEKGDDQLVVKTDKFLDEKRPSHIKHTGLSRNNNLYGYMSIDDKIIDIYSETDSHPHLRTLNDFMKSERHHSVILQLTIDPKKCYISDLDLYDKVKKAIGRGEPSSYLDNLAVTYWSDIKPLSKHFALSDLPKRPEVMVTYDVTPEHIEILS